jgi:hypothetical protein
MSVSNLPPSLPLHDQNTHSSTTSPISLFPPRWPIFFLVKTTTIDHNHHQYSTFRCILNTFSLSI